MSNDRPKPKPGQWCNLPMAGGKECSLRAGHDGPCK